MRLRLTLVVFALLLAAPPAVHAQNDRDARRAEQQARRDSLEAEVVRRFIGKLGRDLKLNAEDRTRMERVLTSSGERRRQLMDATDDLRSRLYRALRDDDTPPAEFTRLLSEHASLRQREHELWQQDQQALAQILSPRQRTHFLLAWADFQDSLREIVSRRMRQDDDEHRH